MKTHKPDDEELFDQAVRDVKPLRHNLAAPKPNRAVLPQKQSNRDESLAEFGEELRYLRPGIQTSALQKLRRGQYPVEATMDLHGLTAAEALGKLQHFLDRSQSAGRQSVRIIHGKGYGSAGRQPVLKTRVRQCLQECPLVLAFCSASPQNGGTGAVDVLLRQLKKH